MRLPGDHSASWSEVGWSSTVSSWLFRHWDFIWCWIRPLSLPIIASLLANQLLSRLVTQHTPENHIHCNRSAAWTSVASTHDCTVKRLDHGKLKALLRPVPTVLLAQIWGNMDRSRLGRGISIQLLQPLSVPSCPQYTHILAQSSSCTIHSLPTAYPNLLGSGLPQSGPVTWPPQLNSQILLYGTLATAVKYAARMKIPVAQWAGP